MTQKLQPGDFALVTSGSMLGESVQLVGMVRPGEMVTIGDRTFAFQPKPSLAAWQVKGRQGWGFKSPVALMSLCTPVSSWEGAE